MKFFQYLNYFFIISKYKVMKFTILVTLICLASARFIDQHAFYAAIAYEPAESITNWSCKYCSRFQVRSPVVIRANGLQGFVVYDSFQDEIIVAFRGIIPNPLDILGADATLTTYPCDGCLVNKDFYQSWLNLKYDVIKTLQQLIALYRSAWIIVVGHNMGGAIAILASVDILDNFGSRGFHTVCTYGQPRAGNKNFAEFVNKKLESKNSFRFVHYADPIPHFPPLGIYKHGITEFWYDEEMIYLDQCTDDAEGECSNSLTSFTNDDHYMEGYLQKLKLLSRKA